jgi:peptidoglycan/xylan/chitin deacetylase (PgdA/CDA1 family)
MKRFSIAISLFLVAIITGVTIATSPSSVVKAEVPNGVISIAFDDNYQNQFNYAFPSMQKYGMVGTFYVCTAHIGASGYMTAAQLQTLENSGNEIGSHSHTHTSFTLLSSDQIKYECDHSKQILSGLGFQVTNFAYPDGVTNDSIDGIVSGYYRSGRTAYVEPYLMEAPTSQFSLAGFSAETADNTALPLLKGMVDQVKATNGWAIIFFHNIIPNTYTQPYTTSQEDFESFLDYTISKGVQTLTVNQVLNLTPLSTAANFGTVSPTSGLYNLGDTMSIMASSPSVVTGERYVWLGWTGSGEGSYSGSSNPASITLNGPIQQTASWRHEFKLTITGENGDTSPSAGEYWYEAGTTIIVEANLPTALPGERYEWSGWAGTGTSSYSGSDMRASIVINGPITQSASWIHEYFVNVSSIVGVVGGTGWYNSGATAYATVNSQFIDESSDVRKVFTSWSGDAAGSGLTSDPIMVNGPKSVTAVWKKQYLVVFDQTGLPNNTNPNVLVNFTNHDLPFSIWIDDGDRIEFAFPDQFQGHALTFPLNESSFVVTSPVRMTAEYSTGYDIGLLVLIIVPLVSVFILASVLLLRRKKASS